MRDDIFTDKEAIVHVDLRGTTKAKVVMQDIMASIGSTVYIRDGIVVYVQPPAPSNCLDSAVPQPPPWPKPPPRTVLPARLTPAIQETDDDMGEETYRERILSLLREQDEPRNREWIKNNLEGEARPATVASVLSKMKHAGLIKAARDYSSRKVKYLYSIDEQAPAGL